MSLMIKNYILYLPLKRSAKQGCGGNLYPLSASTPIRLADKQAKPCLLACLLVLAVSKQSSKRPYFGQSSKQRKGLLACLLVYCLYIVNLVVAVVGNRPSVSLQ